MRLLEVMNCLKVCGGAENFEVNFCKLAQEHTDFYPTILYESHGCPLYNKLVSFSKKEPFTIGKRNSFDFKAICRLHRFIKINKIQVIHTENNCLITAYIASFFQGTPIIHTIHLPPDKEASGFFAKFLYKIIYRSKRVTPVTLTEENTSLFAKTYHFKKMIYCIKNGVNNEDFVSSIPLGKRQIDCAVLARMSEPKNYPFILEVIYRAHSLNSKLHFEIYGDGEMESFVLAFWKERHMEGYLSIHKPTSSPKDVLMNTKTLLLPSLFEASPMVIMEAMSSGCVCIASDVGGIPDLITSGSDGFLFPLGDPVVFARKICEVSENPDFFLSISKTAEDRALASYSIQRAWSQYFELFLNVGKSEKINHR